MGSGLRADEVLMVGDDIRDDVLGAQAAGLKENKISNSIIRRQLFY